MIEIDEDESDHRRDEGELDEVLEARAVSYEGHERSGADRELDEGVPERDAFPAVAAPAPEQDVAHDGDVVVRRDRLTARGTARTGRNERLLRGEGDG